MKRFSLLLALLGSLVWAGAASAATVEEVADGLALRGYFLEGTAASSTVNLLEEVIPGATAGGAPVHVVRLASDPPQGNDAFARSVQALLSDEDAGTIYVQSPGEIGADSTVFDDAALDAAFDATVDGARRCFDAGAVAFLQALGVAVDATVTCPRAAPASGGGSSGGSGSDGGSGPGWFLAFALGIPLVGLAIGWFQRRAGRQRAAAELTKAKAELETQFLAVTSAIVEIEDDVQLAQAPEVQEHFRAANERFATLKDEIAKAATLAECVQVASRIDETRWHVAAVEALAAGKPVPPQPKPEAPAACFFDPTHRPATTSATLTTAAGTKQVGVCASCAELLARGEQPQTRKIDVNGVQVPAAKAPRSHGGLGMGGLDAFQVVLDALLGGGQSGGGSGVRFDWGRPLGGSRSVGSSWTPDLTPSRPRTSFGSGSRSIGSSRRSLGGGSRRSGGSRSIGRARRRL